MSALKISFSFLVLVLAWSASAQTNVTIPWEDVDKTGSTLADLTTRNFSDLQNTPTTVAGYGITDAITTAGGQTIAGPLSIFDDANSGIIRLLRDSSTGRGSLYFGRNNSGTHQLTSQISGVSDTASVNNGQLSFYNSNSAGTLTNVMTLTGGTLASNRLDVKYTTASTSASTGALTVGGGVGVVGAGYFGAAVSANSFTTTQAGSDTVDMGARFRLGISGQGVSYQLSAAGNLDQWIFSGASWWKAYTLDRASRSLQLLSTTASTSTTTGALTVAGGVGVVGALNVGGGIAGTGSITNTGSGSIAQVRVISTVPYQGAITIDGGGGVQIQRKVSGAVAGAFSITSDNAFATAMPITLTSTTEATIAGDGSLTTAGGIYAAKTVQAYGGLAVREHTFTRTNSTTLTLNNGLTVGGELHTGSGRKKATSVKTTTYTVTVTDNVIICAHATTPFTVTLIDAAANDDREYYIKNKGPATVTVDAASLGQIFDSSAVDTITLTTGQSAHLISDGITWNRL